MNFPANKIASPQRCQEGPARIFRREKRTVTFSPRPNTGEVWLKLWDSHHRLRSGEFIKINRNPEGARRGPGPSLYWCGRVAYIADQNVYLGETELQTIPE